MTKPRCGSCFFWEHAPDIPIKQVSASGVLVDASELGVRIGHCYGHPPMVVMVPVQSFQGMTMNPQYIDRQVMDSRPGCLLHPDNATRLAVVSGKAAYEAVMFPGVHYPGDGDKN